MENLHHKPIKLFKLDGNIHDDSAIGRLRLEYIRLLNAEMRFAGYVPRYDIDPDFTIRYNESKECFEFKLSVYGTYVGKKKSEWIKAIDGTKLILTPESKSKELLQDQESQSNLK